MFAVDIGTRHLRIAGSAALAGYLQLDAVHDAGGGSIAFPKAWLSQHRSISPSLVDVLGLRPQLKATISRHHVTSTVPYRTAAERVWRATGLYECEGWSSVDVLTYLLCKLRRAAGHEQGPIRCLATVADGATAIERWLVRDAMQRSFFHVERIIPTTDAIAVALMRAGGGRGNYLIVHVGFGSSAVARYEAEPAVIVHTGYARTVPIGALHVAADAVDCRLHVGAERRWCLARCLGRLGLASSMARRHLACSCAPRVGALVASVLEAAEQIPTAAESVVVVTGSGASCPAISSVLVPELERRWSRVRIRRDLTPVEGAAAFARILDGTLPAPTLLSCLPLDIALPDSGLEPICPRGAGIPTRAKQSILVRGPADTIGLRFGHELTSIRLDQPIECDVRAMVDVSIDITRESTVNVIVSRGGIVIGRGCFPQLSFGGVEYDVAQIAPAASALG